MRSIEAGASAVVFGAGGGIGAALVTALLDDPAFANVYALSRTFTSAADGRFIRLPADVTDEASIAQAARDITGTLRLVIVATGALHGAALRPEKTFRAIESAALLESFRVNAIGPALVAKHMLPLMKAAGATSSPPCRRVSPASATTSSVRSKIGAYFDGAVDKTSPMALNLRIDGAFHPNPCPPDRRVNRSRGLIPARCRRRRIQDHRCDLDFARNAQRHQTWP